MARVVIEQTSWISGELDSSLGGRLDLGTRSNGAAVLENLIVKPSGSLIRRPGSRFRSTVSPGARVVYLGRQRVSMKAVRTSLDYLLKYRFSPYKKFLLKSTVPERYADILLASREQRATLAHASDARWVDGHMLAIFAPGKRPQLWSEYEQELLDPRFVLPDAYKDERAAQFEWTREDIEQMDYCAFSKTAWLFVTPKRPPLLMYVPFGDNPADGWLCEMLLWPEGSDGDKSTGSFRNEFLRNSKAPRFRPDSGTEVRLERYKTEEYRMEFRGLLGGDAFTHDMSTQYGQTLTIRVGKTEFYVTYNPIPDRVWKGRAYMTVKPIKSGTRPDILETWTKDWSVPVFSSGLGFPSVCAVHGNRLVLAGGGFWNRSRLWMSQVNDYFNFDPGTGLADEAIDLRLNAKERIMGLVSANELEVYTDQGVWSILGSPVTPEDGRLVRTGNHGSWLKGSPISRRVRPIRGEGLSLFAGSNNRLSGLHWVGEDLAPRAEDLSRFAGHLVRDIEEIHHDVSRRRLLVLCSDGLVACGTWLPEQNVLAWTRWRASPWAPASMRASLQARAFERFDDARFLSLASSGTGEVWAVVKRGEQCTLEQFDEDPSLADPVGLDSFLEARELALNRWRALSGVWKGRSWDSIYINRGFSATGRYRMVGVGDKPNELYPTGREFVIQASTGVDYDFSLQGKSLYRMVGGYPIWARIEPLPPVLPSNAGSGRRKVRAVQISFLVRRALGSAQVGAAYDFGLLHPQADLGFVERGGGFQPLLLDSRVVSPSRSMLAAGDSTWGTASVRGASWWGSGDGPLWGWFSRAPSSAEILSVKLDLRVGEL